MLYEDMYAESIDNARYSNDGLWIVAIVDNKRLVLWSSEREIIERTIDFKGFLSAIVFSKDSRKLFYSDCTKVYCLKLDSLKEKRERFLAGTGDIRGFKVLRNAKILAWDQTKLYLIEKDFKKNLRVLKILGGENSESELQATITENEQFIAFSYGLKIEIFQSSSLYTDFEQIKTIKISRFVHKLKFSRTGLFLIVVFEENDLVLFKKDEILSGFKLVTLLGKKLDLPEKDKNASISEIAFSENEEMLAIAQSQSNISIYSLTHSTITITKTLTYNLFKVSCISFAKTRN